MKKIYILILLLILTFSSEAQTFSVKVGDKIDSTTVVTAVSECANYIWAGTNKGLYKICKKNKKDRIYTMVNSCLPCNYITSICCRTNGDVWIGTAKGILVFDGYAFMLVNEDNSKLPENFITSLKEDKNNDLWIGTHKSGIIKVHHNRFFLYNHANSSLHNNIICGITADNQNNLIITSLAKDSMPVSSLVKK